MKSSPKKYPWPLGTNITIRPRLTKCGKPGCRCAKGKGHGPYYYAYWKEDGKSRSAYLGKEQPVELMVKFNAKRIFGPDENERIERLREAYARNPYIPAHHATRILDLLDNLQDALVMVLDPAEKEAQATKKPARLLSASRLREQALEKI